VRSDDKAHWQFEVDALSLNFRRHWREGRGALHRDHGLAIDQRRAGGLINVLLITLPERSTENPTVTSPSFQPVQCLNGLRRLNPSLVTLATIERFHAPTAAES
jgi:hypothetical protein